MSFTDEDLMRVKKYLDEKNWIYQPPQEVLKALIARLEAAEDLASCADRNEFKNIYEKWHKAAGK